MNRIVLTAWSILRNQTHKEWIPYALLGLLVVALWVPRIHGPIDFRWDGGVYYVLGTSLAEGKGYRLLNEPGEIQANQYPPLLPLIIAAHQIVLGTSDPLVVGHFLRFSAFVVFAIYMFATHLLLRRQLSKGHAFFGTAISLLSMHTYFLSDLCFPDMLYGLLTIGFLLACSNDKQEGVYAWAGACAITAFGLRTAGIALLVAWIGEGFMRRQWKTAILRAVIAVVPVVVWFSYVHTVETSAEYQHPAYAYQRADYMFYNVSYARNVSLNDPFDPDLGYATTSDRLERLFGNMIKVTRYIGESVSSSRRVWEIEREEFAKRVGLDAGPEWIVDVPLFVLGGLVLVGTGLLVCRGNLIIPLCIVCSVGLVCLTPWPAQFNRYLMPTVPLLALSLCVTIAWILEQSQPPRLSRWQVVSRVLVCAVVVGIGLQQIATVGVIYTKRLLPVQYNTRQGERVGYRLFFYMDSYRALDAGVDWLITHTKPTDVIAVSMPHWVYLRTGNKTVMPPFESDPVKAQQLLESVSITYLILDEGLAIDSKRFMRGPIERFPDRWKRVYSDDILTETGVRREHAFEIYERVEAHPAALEPDTIPEHPVHQRSFSVKETHEIG